MNVILCGLQGVGKTTVGRRLAEWMGWSFVDTDRLIESGYGSMTCREIAKKESETFFRRLEKEVINGLQGSVQTVIAVGGGSVPGNEKTLQALGTIIYLKVTPKTVWQRIKKGGIPSYVDSGNPESSFYAIAEKRMVLFERIARCVVDTENLSEDAVLEQVLGAYGKQ